MPDTESGSRRRPLSITRIVPAALTVLLITLPIAIAASVERTVSAPGFLSQLRYLLPVFIATLFLSCVTLIADSSRESGIARKHQFGAIVFTITLVWLFLDRLWLGEMTPARNVAIVLTTFFAIYISAARGRIDVGRVLRNTTRIVAIYSVLVFLAYPGWYINEGLYRQPGKLLSSLPNAQGIFIHANITGLFFGAAFVIELALWEGRPGRWRVGSLLFGGLSLLLLLQTQSRTATAATIIAAGSVICYRYGKTLWASAAIFVGLIMSLFPMVVNVIPGFFGDGITSGGSILGEIGARNTIWTAVTEVILHSSLLFGSGSAGITTALGSAYRDVYLDSIDHAHNQFMDLLLASGLMAAMLFCFLIWIIGLRVKMGRLRPEGVGLAVLLVWSSITETPITAYVAQVGVALFILMITLLFAPRSEIKDRSDIGAEIIRLPDDRQLFLSCADARASTMR